MKSRKAIYLFLRQFPRNLIGIRIIPSHLHCLPETVAEVSAAPFAGVHPFRKILRVSGTRGKMSPVKLRNSLEQMAVGSRSDCHLSAGTEKFPKLSAYLFPAAAFPLPRSFPNLTERPRKKNSLPSQTFTDPAPSAGGWREATERPRFPMPDRPPRKENSK